MAKAFTTLTRAQQRASLIRRCRSGLAEIRQIHIDVDYWNDAVRPPGVAPINPDPGGDLARLALYYERILKEVDTDQEPPSS